VAPIRGFVTICSRRRVWRSTVTNGFT